MLCVNMKPLHFYIHVSSAGIDANITGIPIQPFMFCVQVQNILLNTAVSFIRFKYSDCEIEFRRQYCDYYNFHVVYKPIKSSLVC